MSAQTTNWLMDQAAASAERLASAPTELLGPAGRSLQLVASKWGIFDGGLNLVAVGKDRPPRGSGSKSTRRQSSGTSERSVQMPLMTSIDAND